MTGEMTHQRAIELEAEKLERLSVQLIQDKNWQALDQMLAPGCQFVSSQGACDKAFAVTIRMDRILSFAQLPSVQKLKD